MKTQHFRHVTVHNGQFTFQLTVLGNPLRASEHWDDPKSAGVAADLAKHFFRDWFYIDLPRSLDPEEFSMLASRLNVVLSDRLSVESALAPGVRTFVLAHRDALAEYAAQNKPERTAWSILRNSPEFSTNPALRKWVVSCEQAELDAECFAKVNLEYVHRMLLASSSRLRDAMPSLRAAIKTLGKTENGTRLGVWPVDIIELLSRIETDSRLAEGLAHRLVNEQAEVETALSRLEANRPPLI